jgi:hypothetical protein
VATPRFASSSTFQKRYRDCPELHRKRIILSWSFSEGEQRRLKSELLLAKLRQEISQADYVTANARFDTEITALEQRLHALHTDDIEFDAFLRFGQAMLLDMAKAWQLAEPEQKIGVQELLFQDGISYSQESGQFEHRNPCLFNCDGKDAGQKLVVGVPDGI